MFTVILKMDELLLVNLLSSGSYIVFAAHITFWSLSNQKDDAPVLYGKHGRPVRGNRKQVNYEEMVDDKAGDDEGDELGSFFNAEGKEEATDVKK